MNRCKVVPSDRLCQGLDFSVCYLSLQDVQNQQTRRRLIAAAGVGIVGTVLAGCLDAQAEDSDDETDDDADIEVSGSAGTSAE